MKEHFAEQSITYLKQEGYVKSRYPMDIVALGLDLLGLLIITEVSEEVENTVNILLLHSF